MGGAGKGTLLHHLGWWWQKTRFVERVFYFGYDAKAYHLAEMVQRMGHDRGLDLSGRAAEDRAAVLRALNSRCLLILDNLETVTGTALAVQNTLFAQQQLEHDHHLLFCCAQIKEDRIRYLGKLFATYIALEDAPFPALGLVRRYRLDVPSVF